MSKKTLTNLIFTALCVITVMTSCFDCVVSLATAEELKGGSEQNPIWAAFLVGGSVRAMVGLKFTGIFLSSLIMYSIRNNRLRFAVMGPIALFHVWLFLTLNFGVSGHLFSFDFSDPFSLIRTVAHKLQIGAIR